jgi:hypothetical protein
MHLINAQIMEYIKLGSIGFSQNFLSFYEQITLLF